MPNKQKLSIEDLTNKILKFRDEREWAKYHTPKNLALSIVIELGELLEHFQWKSNEEIFEDIKNDKTKKEIEEELADVLIYIFLLGHELGIDLTSAIEKKVKLNEKKYPVHLVKGRYRKLKEGKNK